MGGVNCCVDASVVDDRAYSTCASTSASPLHISSKSVDPVEESNAKEASTRVAEDTPVTPQVVVAGASDHVAERHSDSTVVKRARTRRKKRVARRTQSLGYAIPERQIWLSDYLCPCDPCPHTQATDRLLEAFYHSRSLNGEEVAVPMRTSLYRVVRGCATFDERKRVDLDVVERARRVLDEHRGDEDEAFRAMVKPTKQTPPAQFSLPPQPLVDHTVAMQRRNSAVTA